MPPEAATIEKPAPYPTEQPLQYCFEVQEVRPHLRAAADGTSAPDENAFDIVISSEFRAMKYGAVEVLGHKEGEVDLTYAKNGLSLLLEHGGRVSGDYRAIDPALHVGIVDDVKLDKGKLVGVMTFDSSPLGQQTKQQWKERSRRFISAGYVPMETTQTKAAKSYSDVSEYRLTKWQPREVTITSVPVDPNAKGRSAGAETFSVQLRALSPEGESPMPPTEVAPTTAPAAIAAPAAAPAALAIETRSLGEAVGSRNKEVADIYRLCESHGLQARAAEFVEKGLTLLQAKSELLDALSTRGGRQPAAELLDGLSGKDRKRYSFRNVMQAALERRALTGLEATVSDQLIKAKPTEMSLNGGYLVPFDLRNEQEIELAEEARLEGRTMTSKDAGKGLELIADARGQLIDLLQANSVLSRLGAVFLPGLTSPMTFPRITSAPTVTWQGENPATDATESDTGTGELLVTPKQLIGATPMSRGLIYQTSGMAEAMVRRCLAIGHDLALDRGGLHGTGAANQPTGLYNLAGVQTVAMGSVTPTYTKITEMIGKVADANAEFGNLGFVETAILAARHMATPMFTNSSLPVWTGPIDDGRISGYRAIGSTQIRKDLGAGADEHGLAFGNWGSVIIGMFGALEILVDPYTGALRGLIKVRSYSAGDVLFQQPQGMCIATAAKPA